MFKGGKVLRVVLDLFGNAVKPVGVLFSQQIYVADDPVALAVGNDVVLDPIKAFRSAERIKLKRFAFDRRHAVRRYAVVPGHNLRIAGVEFYGAIHKRRVIHTDRAAFGGAQRQTKLRLDAHEVRSAAGADEDRVFRGADIQRAVAAEGDAAAAALRLGTDRAKAAASHEADPEVRAHHRKHEIRRRRVEIRQRQRIGRRVVDDPFRQKILRVGLFVRVQDLLFDLVVGRENDLVGSARQRDRSPHAVHRLTENGGGALRRKSRQKQYAKDQTDPFLPFHSVSSEVFSARLFPARRSVDAASEKGGRDTLLSLHFTIKTLSLQYILSPRARN